MVCAGVQGGGTDSCEVRAERGHSSGGGEGTRTVLGVGVDLDLFAWGQVERTFGFSVEIKEQEQSEWW
jgi:hypothetical protein